MTVFKTYRDASVAGKVSGVATIFCFGSFAVIGPGSFVNYPLIFLGVKGFKFLHPLIFAGLVAATLFLIAGLDAAAHKEEL